MKRTRILLACGLAALAAQGLRATDSPLPGQWVEAESARNFIKSKPNPKASGGSALGWFVNGLLNTADFRDLPRSGGLLYLRYARGAKTPGAVDVIIGEDRSAKPLVTAELPPTGGWDRFAWTRVRLPDLPSEPGSQMPLSLRATPESADIDCWGVVPEADALNGLWMPPNDYREGKSTDAPTQLPPVSIASVDSPLLGHLLVSENGEGTLPLQMELSSNLDKPVTARVRVRISDESGRGGEPVETSVDLASGGRTKIDLALPSPGFGHWTAAIEVVAGEGTAQATTAFGVIRPSHPGLRPESPFGLSIGETATDAEIGRLIGVKWRRVIPGLPCDKVSPAPGKFWQASDALPIRKVVEDWRAKGIETLGMVDYNMSWNIQPDPLGRKIARHENRPKDLEAHADMVAAMIDPLADLVPNWELWNEPWVHGWTWRTGTAQDYRDLTRLIWDRVKPRNPQVMLIGGGSTPYLRDVPYAKGATNAGYFDGTSTHPYGIPDRATPVPAATEAEMNRRFSKGAGKGGIWATEVGTAEFMFDDLPQKDRPFAVARSVAPVYLLNMLGAGDTPIRIFFFASKYDRQFSGDTFNWWNGRTPKPAVAAYATMTHFLEGAKLIGDLWLDSRAGWALLFKRPNGGSLVALWAEAPYNGTSVLPVSDWRAFDFLGRPIGKVEGENFRVPFEPMSVVYLESESSPEAVKKAFPRATFEGFSPVEANALSLASPIGGRPPLAVQLENLTGQPQTVQIEASGGGLVFDPQTVDLKPYERATSMLPFVSGTTSPLNRYPVTVATTIGGKRFAKESTLQVAAFERLTPKIDGDLSDWEGTRPVTIVSRGTRDTLEIALDPSKAEALLAARRPEDAALYRLRAAYDSDNLYFAAEIPDETPTTNSTFDDDPNAFPFLADSLLLAFDVRDDNPDDLLRGHPLWEKSLGAEVDYEFAITPARRTGDGPSYSKKPAYDPALLAALPLTPELHRLKAPGTNFQTFYPTNPPTNPPLGPIKTPGMSIRHDREKGLFIYEFALPLASIPELKEALAAGRGSSIRFAWAVIDRGNGGRGNSYWTQEAGLVREGAYGFSPHWGGGTRRFGGRIITPWTFEPKTPQ